jgi:hypothetical protein
MEPARLEFGIVRPAERTTRTLTVFIRPEESRGVRETEVRCQPYDQLTASLNDRQESPDGIRETWEIAVQATSSSPPQEGRLWLKINGLDEFGLKVPVFWHLRSLVRANPEMLFLGVGASSEPVRKSLELTVDPGQTLKLAESVETEGPIELAVTSAESDAETTRVEVAAVLREKPGSYVGTLRLHCLAPKGFVVSVPVTCVVLEGQTEPAEFPDAADGQGGAAGPRRPRRVD